MLMKNFMEYLGIEPGRYHLAWISGSEGQKFADVMTKVVEEIRRLGPCGKLRDER